jgi:hypothetical protein
MPGSYTIYVRNSSRQLVGQIDQYDRFSCVLRFNNIASWVLEIDTAHAQAGNLATIGNGIVVYRDGVFLLSGPIRRIERKGISEEKLVVSGSDDLLWLAYRQAWSVWDYPYSALILADSPLRYYRMNEASGGPIDRTGNSAGAVYGGAAVTYSQAGALDDPDTAITTTGVSSLVVPTTGLPTGNTSWTWECWFRISTLPGAGVYYTVFAFGNAGGGTNNVSIYINQFASVFVELGTTIVQFGFTTISINTWYHVALTWDGTTMRFYVNGAQAGTSTPGARNIVYGNAVFLINYPITTFHFLGTIDEGAIYNTALAADKILTRYQTGIERFGRRAYDTQTGTASTVIRGYVDRNAGASALAVRQVAGLTLAADPVIGSSVTGNARFDLLVARDGNGLLQQLARQSSPEIGFRVVQVGTNLQLQLYAPANKTGSVKFSDALGNIAEYTYVVEAPTQGGNYAIVGGGGEGTARVFVEASDATSITSFGRVEAFVDRRDTSDTTLLAQSAAEHLAANKDATGFNAVLTESLTLRYGTDFVLGDKVTVAVEGVTFTEIVREVAITVSSEEGETIVAAVGSPSGGQIITALEQFAASAKNATQRLNTLERRR